MATPVPRTEKQSVLPKASSESTTNAHDFPLRRIAVFGAVVSTVLLAANAYVCATWSYFFGLSGWLVWQAWTGAAAVVFVPATILRFRFSHPALRVIYVLSASWMGALNFAFFAAVACWIAEGAAWLSGWPLPRFTVATIFFGLALVATVYGLINAAWLRVTRVTVKLSHLPEAWRGRTVALVTDLHLGPSSDPGFLRRVIARLRSLQPEAVFISGDMFDGPTLGLDQLVAPWREFRAPSGIFFVTGNHDEFADRRIYLDAVKHTGIQVLNNEKITLDGLQIVGVHDSEAENPTVLRDILRQAQIDRRLPSILLAHRPVNLSVAEEEGISLQLSGHTHGGQIWPWNFLVSRIYGRFAYGLARLHKLQVYTSCGAGTWGPPLRVATWSEIVLIRLEMETDTH